MPHVSTHKIYKTKYKTSLFKLDWFYILRSVILNFIHLLAFWAAINLAVYCVKLLH